MDIKGWIRKVKKEIDAIESKEPKDRLEYTEAISNCNVAIIASSSGWEQWLSNPCIMNKFTQEELVTVHNEFKQLALTFLRNDVKWTEIMSKKLKIKNTDELPFTDERNESTESKHSQEYVA